VSLPKWAFTPVSGAAWPIFTTSSAKAPDAPSTIRLLPKLMLSARENVVVMSLSSSVIAIVV
jgi:hypothetical protein